MALFSVELTPYVRVNAAADKSFRLDYKKLSLKLSCAPSSDKEYSGSLSVCRAESLVIVIISACRGSVGVCVSPLHTCLDVLTRVRLHMFNRVKLHLLMPKIKTAHLSLALGVCVCAGWSLAGWCMSVLFACALCAGVLSCVFVHEIGSPRFFSAGQR